MVDLDEFDYKIIEAMRTDEAISANATLIGKILDKPTATVHSRLKKMQKDMIIRGYIPIIDYERTGRYVNTFVLLRLRTGSNVDNLIRRLRSKDEIREVYSLVGRWKLLLNVKTKTMREQSEFIKKMHEDFEEIAEIYDMISPDTYKRTF